ncbi:DUF2690 domain-containing protein [Kitasatospora sp. NPDC088134]|uniref:DUF2690 domain-containing protein n=1 Tax=Kitasatospora sp. NPDC088134 TaxID=3364071 RepID=UPI00380238D5
MPHSRDADKSEPPTTARVELGKLLNRWRYDAPGKPSQSSVARKVALTQPMVSKYEAGVHVPSREVVRLLAEHYGRPAADLEHALGICARAEQENRGGEKAEQPAPEPPTGTSHPTARRQRLLWLGGVLVLVAVGGGAYAVWGHSDPAGHKNQAAPPANSSAAPSAKETASCSGIACLHTDPSNTACQYDAVTTADGRDFGVFVELRYSPSCRAGWARMDGGSPGDRIQVFGTEGSPPELEEYRQQSGHTAHTKMVQAPVPAGARACAVVQSRGTVCSTPLPGTSSPQPGTTVQGR